MGWVSRLLTQQRPLLLLTQTQEHAETYIAVLHVDINVTCTRMYVHVVVFCCR